MVPFCLFFVIDLTLSIYMIFDFLLPCRCARKLTRLVNFLYSPYRCLFFTPPSWVILDCFYHRICHICILQSHICCNLNFCNCFHVSFYFFVHLYFRFFDCFHLSVSSSLCILKVC
ncbi:hypothetical protein AAHE18_10G251900 [Arachis hypogaea]